MLEVLQFMFSGFWIWLGGLFYLALIASIVNGIAIGLIRVFKR